MSTPTTTAAQFNLEGLEGWSEPVPFEVSAERIRAYAEATNDPIAPHAAGELAPPVFAVVPPFQQLMERLISPERGIVPTELVPMCLHGEHDFRFHEPITAGTTLANRIKVHGIHPRSSGVTVTLLAQSREEASGRLAVEQYMVLFVRGAELDVPYGEEAPEHRISDVVRAAEPLAEVPQTFDADQTFRYSEAAGDPMRVHLDEGAAKAAGLPGIIIHGLCTMAFASVAVIGHACPPEPTRLRRLAVRFSWPAFPEQTITTRIWDAGRRQGCEVLAFETTAEGSGTVIEDGLAEVAS